MFGTTPAETSTPRNPLSLTGTWFGRVGMAPYSLLGLPEAGTSSLRVEDPATVLPLRRIAA